MIPIEPTSRDERRLLKLFRGLAPSDRATWLAFGEFLAGRGDGTSRDPDSDQLSSAAPLAEPTQIPRPPEESVIAAIKRLRGVYHMLDPGSMLNETSALMTEHVLQGRDAAEVIDALEDLFASRYQRYRDAAPDPGAPQQ